MNTNRIKLIKELRQRTSISLRICREVLNQSDWNIEDAIVILQKMGEVNKVNKLNKSKAGVLHTYLHHNNKVAVLLEVNCATDAVANTDKFQQFCENVALHIASESPDYLSVNDIPVHVIDKQREIFLAQVPSHIPPHKVEHVINGKLKKWFGRVVLVEQKSIIVNKKTIEQMRIDLVQQLKENIIIRRFIRWELGDDIIR